MEDLGVKNSPVMGLQNKEIKASFLNSQKYFHSAQGFLTKIIIRAMN